MIKTIWFDIGGTIHTQAADPENDREFAGRLTKLLSSYGIDSIPEPEPLLERLGAGAKRYKEYSEKTLKELEGDVIWAEYMLGDFPQWRKNLEGHGEELSYLFDRHRKVITPRAHVKEVLEELQNDGYRLGIISNIMSKTFVPRILEEYGIRSYFETLVLSSECGIRKADPEIFALALKEMDGKAEEACYIGDTISRDVLGTRNAGWKLMIQIDNPLTYGKDEKYRDLGYAPDYKIYDFQEIPMVLKDFLKRG